MSFIGILQTTIKWVLILAITAIIAGVTLLYFNQNQLIYPSAFPEGSRTKVQKPNEFGLNDWEDVELTTQDSVKIKAYLIKKRLGSKTGPLSKHTLIYFHANAGNMGHRLPIAKAFQDRFQCNILMLSYRGYGLSEGSASEQGFLVLIRFETRCSSSFRLYLEP